MNVIDRYLQEVRQSMFLIGPNRREDILRELEEEIRAEAEAQECESGRGLSETEADAIVQRFGHPLIVAARYRQSGGSLTFGRQLIGPELFPLYASILAVSTALAATALAAISFVSREPLTFSAAVWHLGVQFAIITGIFIAVDRSVRHSVEKGFSMLGTAVVEKNRVSRGNAFFELAITLFLANVWLDLPSYPDSFGLGRVHEWTPGPVWKYFHGTFFIPVVIVFGVSIALSLTYLIDPHRSRRRLLASAAANVAFAGMVAVTAFVHGQTVWSQLALIRSGNPLTQAEKMASSTDITVMSFLLIFGVVALVEALHEMYRAARPAGGGDTRHDAIPTAAI